MFVICAEVVRRHRRRLGVVFPWSAIYICLDWSSCPWVGRILCFFLDRMDLGEINMELSPIVKFVDVLARCDHPDYSIHLGRDESRFYLQISNGRAGVCNVTGESWNWRGRKWFLSEHMTNSEIVGTAFKAILTAVEHEAREMFKYRGESIYDPHYDVEKLVELRRSVDALEERSKSD